MFPVPAFQPNVTDEPGRVDPDAGLVITAGVFVWVVVNVAVTLRACVMLTEQLPLPLQAPPQLENDEPEAALALSVKFVPFEKELLQLPVFEEQLIPLGELVTKPLPLILTESV